LKGKEIAETVLWLILTFFAYLEYFSDFRPYFKMNFGIYVLGFVDGVVAIATFLVLIFYVESFFEKEPKKALVEPKNEFYKRKVDQEFVKEIIKRFDHVENIFNKIVERAGGIFLVTRALRVEPSEEEEFRKEIDWLAENYPKIAEDTKRALRTAHIDNQSIIPDYDPVLQIIQNNSLKSIISRGPNFVKKFQQDLSAGHAKLRAYLGLIKNEQK